MPETRPELDRLEAWFAAIPGAVVAFSGGVDSALALFLARRFLGRGQAIGCIADSPSLKRTDLQVAVDFCERFDIRLEILRPNEIDDPAYHTNPVNRCYACKSHLYAEIGPLLRRLPGFVALNGTNADDLGDYRPGLLAASERQIRSPLADCGIGKTGVRALARRFELPVWDKPASPCLSSRIPYGQPVTREKLRQIEAAETVLADLGFPESRVRHFGEEARIEVPDALIESLLDHAESVRSRFAEIGFSRATIDREGLVSGKLNRAIAEAKTP